MERKHTKSQETLIYELTDMIDNAIRKQSLSTYDDWLKAVENIVLRHRVVPQSLTVMKPLPWICLNCGLKTVQNLRVYKDSSLIAKCDKCGNEVIT